MLGQFASGLTQHLPEMATKNLPRSHFYRRLGELSQWESHRALPPIRWGNAFSPIGR
jgi:hypothetical protein